MATTSYECRRCKAQYRSAWDDGKVRALQTFNDRAWILPPSITGHECEDGGVGNAELIGWEPDIEEDKV